MLLLLNLKSLLAKCFDIQLQRFAKNMFLFIQTAMTPWVLPTFGTLWYATLVSYNKQL